jgi:3-deoxy-D-arabino-heptulosonate 7-phosphate (DAHP) synthase class II
VVRCGTCHEEEAVSEADNIREHTQFMDNLAVEVSFLARQPAAKVAVMAYESNQYEISRVAAIALFENGLDEDTAWQWLKEKYDP